MSVTLKTIMVPLDFSEPGRVALDHAEMLAEAFDAELLLVHIVAPLVYPLALGAVPVASAQVDEHLQQKAAETLKTMAGELSGKGRKVRTRVDLGSAAPRIVDLVKEEAVDMVVMSTHGLTGLAHALMGSVAEKVVRTCPCPVLAVKARAAAEG